MMKMTFAKQDLGVAMAVVAASKASSGNDLSAHYLFRRSAADPAAFLGLIRPEPR